MAITTPVKSTAAIKKTTDNRGKGKNSVRKSSVHPVETKNHFKGTFGKRS
jgi:hypothetical protein